MLQAIAIAEEAAKKGPEKISTKRSLFKLNEAKVEDLKAFLDYSSSPTREETETSKVEAGADVGWVMARDMVRGRLFKKLGKVVKNFKVKNGEEEAVMLDLKAHIEDYEEYVKKKGLQAEKFIDEVK